jgi:hypothetical protein
MQSHPLYADDRATVNRLVSAPTPADADLIDTARLLIRYEGYPGCPDIQADLLNCLDRWGLQRGDLNSLTRAIWASGWRPTAAPDPEAQVGSGADVNG